MKRKSVNNISDEVLAAFLDGNATAQESQAILDMMSEDEGLRELLHISQSVDAELAALPLDAASIPMTAIAASCPEENICSLECEKYILNRFNIEFDEQSLLKESIEHGWLNNDGTALHNIGRLLENHGLHVTRRYNCSIETMAKVMADGECVIAVVDGGELLGNREEELYEEIYIGEIPDHTVIVTSCDLESGTVTVSDPNSPNCEDKYPIEQFIDAWNDSKNFMLSAAPYGCKEYTPTPIDISDIELDEELDRLTETIAENAHEIWALNRKTDGWTYGPKRDDTLKQTPDMVPYAKLPESEKRYDREMAVRTIKLLKKLGYDIVKHKESDNSRSLGRRINPKFGYGKEIRACCSAPDNEIELPDACDESEF